MPYVFGQLNDENTAQAICRRLAARGVTASYVQSTQGSYTLLVEREEDAALAHDYYRVALNIPPRFEIAAEAQAIARVPTGQVTLILIGLCVAVSLATWLGDAESVRALLMISAYTQGLPEIMAGQWWRLLTPAIIHFGFIHLLFNMLWLKSLGSIIELTRGKIYFLSFVFASALISNILQWWFKGPLFGGMSGVVYGLLGFLWMAKEFNPAEEFSLPKQDVMMMIGWFVLCLTGLLGPIANYAHAGGLAIGMVAGIFAGTKAHGHFDSFKVFKFSLAAVVLLGLTWTFETFVSF